VGLVADGPVCVDDDWRFVTSSSGADVSWIHRKIMINRRTFPVDMNSPYAVKRIAEYLQKGGRLVMFPEGRLSRTGSLMKFYEGTGFLLLKTHARSSLPTSAGLINSRFHPIQIKNAGSLNCPFTLAPPCSLPNSHRPASRKSGCI
jgi:1-acyl-sn-glycerol-3-phosphate acyltransferase